MAKDEDSHSWLLPPPGGREEVGVASGLTVRGEACSSCNSRGVVQEEDYDVARKAAIKPTTPHPGACPPPAHPPLSQFLFIADGGL